MTVEMISQPVEMTARMGRQSDWQSVHLKVLGRWAPLR
jgi:hypothetical protein